jgi:hypothetical protein
MEQEDTMQTERFEDTAPGATYPAGSVDRVVEPGTASYVAPNRGFATAPIADVGHNVMIPRNRVQWGPVFAGVVVSLTTMLVLSILGVAIGASAVDRTTDLSDWKTAAGLWGAATVLIAFFLGGLVAAKTAAVGGSGSGIINGLVSGAATLLFLIWLTTAGLTGLAGFLGTNIATLAAAAPPSVVNQATQNANASGATDQAQQAAQNPGQTIETTARNAADETAKGAWGTFLAMLIALVAATLGGFVGHNTRRDLVTGEG